MVDAIELGMTSNRALWNCVQTSTWHSSGGKIELKQVPDVPRLHLPKLNNSMLCSSWQASNHPRGSCLAFGRKGHDQITDV